MHTTIELSQLLLTDENLPAALLKFLIVSVSTVHSKTNYTKSVNNIVECRRNIYLKIILLRREAVHFHQE